MIQVVLLGSGNVATHLTTAFLQAENVELIQIYSRTKSSLKPFEGQIDTTTSLTKLKKADVYIIAISDDAIAEFSLQLRLKDQLVVHTSGSVTMDALNAKNRKGVFYPLQTFTKDNPVDFSGIPICIEAEFNEDLVLLDSLANSISNNIYFVDSAQRKSLHVAAVFVNNFVNHLYHIGHELCEANKVPFEILKPLIQETAQKITELTPYKAQTGPAKRNDQKTIQEHLQMLNEKQQEIYSILTRSIQETYGEEL